MSEGQRKRTAPRYESAGDTVKGGHPLSQGVPLFFSSERDLGLRPTSKTQSLMREPCKPLKRLDRFFNFASCIFFHHSAGREWTKRYRSTESHEMEAGTACWGSTPIMIRRRCLFTLRRVSAVRTRSPAARCRAVPHRSATLRMQPSPRLPSPAAPPPSPSSRPPRHGGYQRSACRP